MGEEPLGQGAARFGAHRKDLEGKSAIGRKHGREILEGSRSLIAPRKAPSAAILHCGNDAMPCGSAPRPKPPVAGAEHLIWHFLVLATGRSIRLRLRLLLARLGALRR
jgi:hypothetical protein